MPPFGRLAAIVVSSESQAEANEVARQIGRAAPSHDNMAVFGPAPAPLAMLRGRHRFRLLVHAARNVPVQDIIRDWLGGLHWKASARVSVDVDPYSFL
jgi:primosomal protein N' (replication factor Y)